LKWNDDELNGAGFSEWTPYQHPQLGDVEIGGWRSRFVLQNPPPHLLKDEIEQYVPWMIWLAEISPKIIIEDIVVTPLSQGGQSKIHIRVANTGFLPTNITQRALDAEIAVPVRIFVELEDAELLDGTARTDIGHLAGSRDNSDTATFGTADYVIRVTGPKPVIRFTIVSEKGGVARKHISL